MNNQPEVSTSLPLAVQRASNSLKIGGQIGFWFQLVLGVVSAVILTVSSFFYFGAKDVSVEAAGMGLVFAFTGLIALGVSIYFSYRYIQLSRRLAIADPSDRPKRATILRQLRIGLIINLAGLLLTILGSQTIVGVVLIKALQQGPFAQRSQEFVTAIDILSIQANINVIFAHTAGILSTIWLQDRLNQQ